MRVEPWMAIRCVPGNREIEKGPVGAGQSADLRRTVADFKPEASLPHVLSRESSHALPNRCSLCRSKGAAAASLVRKIGQSSKVLCATGCGGAASGFLRSVVRVANGHGALLQKKRAERSAKIDMSAEDRHVFRRGKGSGSGHGQSLGARDIYCRTDGNSAMPIYERSKVGRIEDAVSCLEPRGAFLRRRKGRVLGPNAERKQVKLTIWGCRGSIATSGKAVERYGGETSCYVIETPNHRSIFDAGTGLARFARERQISDIPTTLFLSHYHLDHLQGFPFYDPIFRASCDLEVAAVPRDGVGGVDALFHAHRPPFFPVSLKDQCAMQLRSTDLPSEGEGVWGGVRIQWMDAPHPGGASAYRIDVDGHSVVIATDAELMLADARLRQFVANADIAILDAQYRSEEYSPRVGWGHSTPEHTAQFAAETGIKTLYLTHHDPSRSDDEVDAMVEIARAYHPRVFAAYDGLAFDLG